MALSHQLAAGPAANIEGLVQVGELGLGLLLSAVIGLEREVRQKSARLRTHSLVGLGAALFMLSASTASATCCMPARWPRTRPGWPRRSSPASGSSGRG